MKKLLFLFIVPVFVFSFAIDPWYGAVGEFEFRPAYTYRYYPSINKGRNSSDYHSHDHLIDLNLGVQFWPGWDFQIETDFSRTRKLSWGTQCVGLQLRTLIFDDVAGDPISLSLGLQSYYVPTRNLRDVSSPYHAQGNIEVGLAFGKEIDRAYSWLFRVWGFLGTGIANRGFPWMRPVIAAEVKMKEQHRLKLFSEGSFGFGKRHAIHIDRFNGYAKIAHRSVDLGLCYTYRFKIWGALSAQYAYRLYAHSFPERASLLKVEYRLPCSLF